MSIEQKGLCRHPLFKDLSEDGIAFALNFFSAKTDRYRKGEHLLLAGDPFSAFGIVCKGAVAVYMDDIDGERMMMASVGAGESFGESLAYLSTKESPVYIVAATDAEVTWLSTAALRTAQTDTRALLLTQRFTAVLAARALSQNDRIQILSKPTIRARLIAFFSQWERRTKSRTFCVPFDRASLAVYLGINRTALSRELSHMKREGIIDYFKSTFRLLK